MMATADRIVVRRYLMKISIRTSFGVCVSTCFHCQVSTDTKRSEDGEVLDWRSCEALSDELR